MGKLFFGLLILAELFNTSAEAKESSIKKINVYGNNPIIINQNDTTIILSTKVVKATPDFVTPEKYDTDILLQLFDNNGTEIKKLTIKTPSYYDVPVGIVATLNKYIILYHANACAFSDGVHGWGELDIVDKKTFNISKPDSVIQEDPSGLFLLNDSLYIIGSTFRDSSRLDKYHLVCRNLIGKVIWEKFFEGSVGAGDFNGGQYSFKPKHFGNNQFYFPIRKYSRNNKPFSDQMFTWTTEVLFLDYSGNTIKKDVLENIFVKDIYYTTMNTHTEITYKSSNAISIILYLYNNSKVTDSLSLGNSIKGMFDFYILDSDNTFYTAVTSSASCTISLTTISVNNKSIVTIGKSTVDSKQFGSFCVVQTFLVKNESHINVFYSAVPAIKKRPLEAFADTFYQQLK